MHDMYLQKLRAMQPAPTSLIVVGGADNLVSFDSVVVWLFGNWCCVNALVCTCKIAATTCMHNWISWFFNYEFDTKAFLVITPCFSTNMAGRQNTFIYYSSVCACVYVRVCVCTWLCGCLFPEY